MMRSMFNHRFGVTIGIVVGLIFKFVMLEVGRLIYPPPVELDPRDAIQMAQFLSTMPPSQLIFVFASHVSQGVIGVLAGCLSNRKTSQRTGVLVGGITGLFCMLNLMILSHPTWFWLEVPLTIGVGFAIGGWLQSK